MKNFLWPFVSACLVGAIALLAYNLRPQPRIIDNYGPMPAFTLTESNNQQFNSDSMRGKVWAISFFFSSCPNTCPVVNGRMAALSKEFYREPRVHIVSVTVDPETDTAQHLSEYAAKFGELTSKWHFLTGDISKIKSLMTEGLHLAAGESPSMHSTRVILVDANGDIRGYYQGMDAESVAALGMDIRDLLRL